MASKQSKIEIILSAKDLNLNTVVTRGQAAIRAFNAEMQGGSGAASSMRAQILQLAGAFAGLSAISDVGSMLQQADRNAYGLATSIQAANREFAVGSAGDWEQTVVSLSEKLKIYSQSEVRGAAAATIDMTKRLGLNAEQMQRVLELSGELAVGRTDLAGAVERVTSALRGEAEASEYLGLTLNETFVKGWYEAHGAMQGAWKDLTDLQKVQIRLNVFVEQSIQLMGKAAGSINTWSGALQYIKATVADSIATNSELVDSLAHVAEVVRENASGLGDFAAAIATGAARVIEFVAANHEVLIEVVKWSAAFSIAYSVISRLALTWKGLNAAMAAMTGLRIVPWLQGVLAAGNSTTAGLLLLRTAFLRLSIAAAAFFVAYQAGKTISNAIWLSEATKQLQKLQLEIEKTKSRYQKFADFAPSTKESLFEKSRAELDVYKRDLERAYRYQGAVVQDLYAQSRQKGFFGGSTDDAKKASVELAGARERLKELEEAMENYGDVAHTTNAQVAGSSSSAASTMQQVTGEALKAMQKQYQDYAKEVQRLNGEISSRTRSLYSELRDMSRSGMSDYSAWKDQKAEAEEYARAAKQAAQEASAAMSAGDNVTTAEKWKEALQYADDSKAAYKALNTEIKQGEQTVVSQQEALQTAMDGVKESGKLGIEILKEQEAATKSAMDALQSQSSFEKLTEGMDAAEKKWLENWQTMADDTLEKIDKIDTRLDEVANKRRTAKLVIDYEDGSRSVYRTGGLIGGYRSGGLIEKTDKPSPLKPLQLPIGAYRVGGIIQHIQHLATGGGVRSILSGGRLPGYGGGDRRLLLGEDGEVMIRKESVRAAGLKAALAFNAGRWDIVLEELRKRMGNTLGYQLGGLIDALPQVNLPSLAAGGVVSAPATPADTMNITLTFPTGNTVPVMTTKQLARTLLREFEQMGLRASA